jgi:hypothetical protein
MLRRIKCSLILCLYTCEMIIGTGATPRNAFVRQEGVPDERAAAPAVADVPAVSGLQVITYVICVGTQSNSHKEVEINIPATLNSLRNASQAMKLKMVENQSVTSM